MTCHVKSHKRLVCLLCIKVFASINFRLYIFTNTLISVLVLISVALINFRHLLSITNIRKSLTLTMFRKCCVPKCNSLRQDVKLHRFSFKEEVRRHWIKCINSEFVTNSDKNKLYVCHKHFEKKFISASTTRLRNGAYPTMFTALEISSGKPTTFSLSTGK